MLLRRAADIDIHVVITEAPTPARRWARPNPGRLATNFGGATLAVAAAVGIGIAVRHTVALPDLSLIFLAAVLVCAVSLGAPAAIAAALLSFLAYNFFFIQPLYTLTIAEPHELLALTIFLMVAVLTGGLAGRVRDQSLAARKRIATIQALYDVSRKLSGTTSLDDVLWVVARQAAAAVKGQVLILLPPIEDEAGDLAIQVAFPPEDALAPGEWAAARWAFGKGVPAGWRTDTLPSAHYRFLPIRTSRGIVGVVGFEPADSARNLPAEDERAFMALLDQGAISIERAMLVGDAHRTQALAERERLQATLLSSISHDLRTPLASILGAATSLRNYGPRMSPADRDDLLAAIEEESRRLARFVSNLLDMTRVESGGAGLKHDWIDAADVLAGSVRRARKAFPARDVESKRRRQPAAGAGRRHPLRTGAVQPARQRR